jgi:hypothetical protein
MYGTVVETHPHLRQSKKIPGSKFKGSLSQPPLRFAVPKY